MVCPKAERKKAISPTPPLQPGVGASSQYLFYKFGQNSTTITNSGSGGDTYNGTATRAQYAKDSVGYPIWGPLDANTDGIRIPGGISNPYNHTWEIGLNIHQWWPGLGCPGDLQTGNDGKLWSAAQDDLFYGYIHGLASGCLIGISTRRCNLNVEIAYNSAPSYDEGGSEVQFWLGTGDNKPVHVPADGAYDEGRIYWTFSNALFSLNTNYYFQITVNLEDPGAYVDTSGTYSIGNCLNTGSPCSDPNVTGFPCGCYLYVWREYNSAQNLSGGLDWADDVVLWKGGGPGPGPPGPTPTPGTAPNVNMCVNVREYQPGQE